MLGPVIMMPVLSFWKFMVKSKVGKLKAKLGGKKK
jgi:hypothetical protein